MFSNGVTEKAESTCSPVFTWRSPVDLETRELDLRFWQEKENLFVCCRDVFGVEGA